jgi:hypothetical protein
MKKSIMVFLVASLAMMPALIGAVFSLEIVHLGGGQIQVISENISPTGAGDVIEATTNLVTWTPVITNKTFNVSGTNTFQITNVVIFYRARIY